MATTLKLKSDIKKLKAAIDRKGTPANILPKLKAQLEKVENELASMKKGASPRKVSTTKGTTSTLSKLQKMVQSKKYSVYQGSSVDLKKDADEGAMHTGRRTSKGLKANQYGTAKQNKGNTYYEYRANRSDVKQPKVKQTYPKLEKGGYMADGEMIDVNGFPFKLSRFIKENKTKSEEVKLSEEDILRIKKLKKGQSENFFVQGRTMRVTKMASGGMMADGGKTKDEPKVIRGYSDDEPYEYAKGGRLYKDWNGNKQIDQYGIHDLSKMYDNNFDLIADVHDYFIELKHEINENYADEMKNQLIEVLKSGKFKFNDGATQTFKEGGTLGKVGSKTHRYDK